MEKLFNMEFNLHIRSQYDFLYDLVIKSPINITSIKDKDGFAVKHIMDSLYYLIKYPKNINTVADVGSGGGFPGLALAIYFSDWKITLIESIGKKCKFLESTVKKLGLKNVNIINSRAEMLNGCRFDLITARGVGTVKEVLRYTSNLADNNTAWLMYKGENLSAEMEDAGAEISKRGLKNEIVRIEEPFTRSYLYMHY